MGRAARLIAVGLLLAWGGFAAWRATTTEGFVQADEVTHYLYARHAPAHPMNLLHVWARPLYTALLVPFAQSGVGAARFLAVLSALVAAACAWRACATLGWRTAACAVPFTFAQPLFMEQSAGIWTEITFAAVMGVWTVAIASGRIRGACAVAAALPLIRPEGVLVACVTAIAALVCPPAGAGWRARLLPILILPLGVILWAAAGWIASGDPLWLPRHWPADWAPSVAWGRGGWTWIAGAVAQVVPPVLIPLALLGACAPGMRRAWPLLLAVVVVLGTHAVLWGLGAFGSAGYARYFVTLAPVLAVLMTGGVEIAGRLLARVPAAAWLGAATAAAVAIVALHPTAARRPPLPPDVRTLAAAGAWIRAQDGAAVVHSAHPFTYLAIDAVPLPRFEDFGYVSRAELDAAPRGAWLLVENRFYAPAHHDGGPPPRNVPAGGLPALGFHPVATPRFEAGAVTDPRQDPRTADIGLMVFRKEAR